MSSNTPPNSSGKAQQNSLGELFVNLGVGGLPNVLKGLNLLSAEFLLAKNAAQQFTKPLIDMSKMGGDAVTQFDKINAVTGLSIEKLQDLKIWSRLNNVEFGGLVEQLSKMQQNLLNIRLGQGDVRGWSLLGLDPNAFDYRDPIKAFEAIRDRVQELDEATGALALSYLGFSPEMLYALKQQNNEWDHNFDLTKKEMENLREQKRLWNELGIAWDQALQVLGGNFQWINTLIERAIGALRQLIDLARDPKGYLKNLGNKINTNIDNTLNQNPTDLYEDIKNKASKSKIKLSPPVKLAIEAFGNYVNYANNARTPSITDLITPKLPKTIRPETPSYKNAVTAQPYTSTKDLLIDRAVRGLTDMSPFGFINKIFSPLVPLLQNSAGMGNSGFKGNVNVSINQNITGSDANTIATMSAEEIANVMIELQQQAAV